MQIFVSILIKENQNQTIRCKLQLDPIPPKTDELIHIDDLQGPPCKCYTESQCEGKRNGILLTGIFNETF